MTKIPESCSSWAQDLTGTPKSLSSWGRDFNKSLIVFLPWGQDNCSSWWLLSYVLVFSYYTMTQTVQLSQFWLGKLSNGLYAAFLNVFSTFVQKATPAKLWLKADDFTKFQQLLAQLDDAVLQVRKEQLTQELDQLDTQRDQVLRFLLSSISLNQNSPVPANQAAAKALTDFRARYLDTIKKANITETTEIKGLLIDAEKADYAPHFTTLGLTATLTALKTFNDAYNEKWTARIEKQATAPLPVVKDLRTQLDTLYQEMTIKANAVNIVTPIAETESFVVKMNKLIADTNLAHKQHKAQIGLWTEEGGREDEENLADEEKSE